MTIRHAERITGLELRLVPSPGHLILITAMDGEREIARAAGSTEKYAASALVEVVYKLRSRQAMGEQGWRCGQCFGLFPLQCHHIHKRSHGRIDLRTNFIALCAACHEDIERSRVKLDPHPEVRKAVARNGGLTWGGDQWIPTTG